MQGVASHGVLGEFRPNGILANTATSAVSVPSDLPGIRQSTGMGQWRFQLPLKLYR